MNHYRLRFLKLLTVLFGSLLAIVVVESSIRLFHLYSEDRLIAHHPHYGVMNIPGASGWFVKGDVRQHVSINSLGLRDHQYDQKQLLNKTILLLGDSFISAFQVPLHETCQAVTERILAETVNEPIEILPGACNGWGTKNQLEYMEREGLAHNPVMVVLALFPDNDLMDNLAPDPLPFPWPPETKRTFTLLTPGYVRTLLGSNPHVRSILRNNDTLFRFLHPALYRAEHAVTRGLFHIYSRSPSRIKNRMWKKLSFYLRAMIRSAEETGAQFAVMIVPGTFAFNPANMEQLCRKQPMLEGAHLDPLAPRIELEDSLVAMGIRWIDLLPEFKRVGTNTNDLFYPREGHWNEKGNRIAAQCLAELIMEGLKRKWRSF